MSYPSQRVGTGKPVKGWVLEYIHKNESADELEARIRAKLASMTKGLPALQTVQDVEPRQPDAGQ